MAGSGIRGSGSGSGSVGRVGGVGVGGVGGGGSGCEVAAGAAAAVVVSSSSSSSLSSSPSIVARRFNIHTPPRSPGFLGDEATPELGEPQQHTHTPKDAHTDAFALQSCPADRNNTHQHTTNMASSSTAQTVQTFCVHSDSDVTEDQPPSSWYCTSDEEDNTPFEVLNAAVLALRDPKYCIKDRKLAAKVGTHLRKIATKSKKKHTPHNIHAPARGRSRSP
jgi:hypothetical protein